MSTTTTVCWRNAARAFACRRLYSVKTEIPSIREQLTAEVKTAMKSKDTFKSTLLRSVLSEVYAADKAKGKLPDTGVISVLRKAVERRNEAIAQFTKASRQDLADIETREAEALNAFLPPLLSQTEIDTRLHAAIQEADLKPTDKGTGKVMKAFYSKTDRSEVDAALVKQRLDALLSSSA